MGAEDRPPFAADDGDLVAQPTDEAWVRSGDSPQQVAQNLVDLVREFGETRVSAIGARAVNQAVKGIAIARELYFTMYGFDLFCIPYFSTIIDRERRTRTRLVLVVRIAP